LFPTLAHAKGVLVCENAFCHDRGFHDSEKRIK
jgi:hypothetical protein